MVVCFIKRKLQKLDVLVARVGDITCGGLQTKMEQEMMEL